ncbi:hypothetical protein J6590_032075 [Homalodisca vitripennis]|nr:hypothetical protein J6590_032075 [Homalodisca vitripennis]
MDLSYKICCTECGDSLTQLRLCVAARVLAALVRIGGGSVSSDGQEKIHLSNTGTSTQSILVNLARVTSAPNMSEEEFVRTRTEDILVMSDHKNMTKQSLEQLVSAAVTFDLLSIKLEKPLYLDVTLQPSAARRSNNKVSDFEGTNISKEGAQVLLGLCAETTVSFPRKVKKQKYSFIIILFVDLWHDMRISHSAYTYCTPTFKTQPPVERAF